MSSALSSMLANADELLARGSTRRELRREYEDLSAAYKANLRTPRDVSPEAIAAYAIGRLPATVAVSVEVLRQVSLVREGWRPRSVVDMGAGLGAASWAAVTTLPTVEQVTLYEDAPRMVAAGKDLAAGADLDAIRNATWRQTDSGFSGLNSADLVMASYVLGEVVDLKAAVQAWWLATDDTLVIIEPGTPTGFARVLAARSQLLDLGASICAPCPHESECPIAAPGWCHFATRIARSRAHRAIKNAELGSEDEKFSYVAATRSGASRRPAGRVIRRPAKRGGHVRLTVCASDGIDERVIASSQSDYKSAKKLRWGDPVNGHE